MIKLSYRPEIDGLRALAVIAVILYHVEVFYKDLKIFSGGFIGVDIFFVISGYLITSLIIKEINLENNFSLKNFYKRRIKRIIPALFAVITTSIIFAWIYLTPNSFLQYSNSIIASVFFFSNYFFYFQDLVYNAESSLLKPLLHTWSLAVEEQFYIFFPIFVIIIFKFFKKKFFLSFIILFILSFLISFFVTSNNPSLSFFSSFSRGWELLAGSLIAYSEINNKRVRIPFENFLPFIGLCLIFYSFFFFNNNTIHPSLITLIPIIGVSLIIYYSNSGEYAYKILSNKIFVSTGLISYSLYLWHFPIFAFARNRGKDLSDYDKLELLLLTIVLSIISYFIIERPFRRSTFLSFKYLSAILIFLISFFIFFNYHSNKNNGFEDRIHVFLKNSQRANLWEKMSDDKGVCFDRVNDFCNYKKIEEKSIFLIGDSHMEVLSESFYKKIEKDPVNFISINRGGCIYLPNFYKLYLKTKKEYHNCTFESKQIIDKLIFDQKNSIVILGGNFKEHFGENINWEYKTDANLEPIEVFKNSINYLLENDVKVLLVYPIPSVDFDVVKRLMNEIPKSSFNVSKYLKNNKLTTELKDYFDQNKNILNIFNSINHPNLIKVFPEKIFCDTGISKKCFTHDEKNIFYSDKQHLALKGTEMLANEIYSKLKILIRD